MFRRILIALFGALTFAGIAIPASANVSVPAQTSIFNVNIKNNNGAGPVTVTDKNGNVSIGATVSGSASTGNMNQHWNLVQNTSACGDGFVHNASACPFTPGSGLNTIYNGDVILTVCLRNDPGFCMAIQSHLGTTNLQSPNGTGTNWISDSPNHLVNRVASDQVGQGQCLFNDGTLGDPLAVSTCNLSNARIGWEVNAF